MFVALAQAQAGSAAEADIRTIGVWLLLAMIGVVGWFLRKELLDLIKGVAAVQKMTAENGTKTDATISSLNVHARELARLTVGIEIAGAKIEDAVTTINGHTTKIELLEFRVQILERERRPAEPGKS